MKGSRISDLMDWGMKDCGMQIAECGFNELIVRIIDLFDNSGNVLPGGGTEDEF